MADKNRFDLLKFLSKWALFGFSVIIIIGYIIFSVQPQKTDASNIGANVLFTFLNLIAAFYISRQVSLWGWQTDNAASQKKIAKTAIRHTRANLVSIIKLIKITREKIDLAQNPLTIQYLKEIKNHLEMIYNGIKNSEADFNEIVNEELKVQNLLEVEIGGLFEEIEQKSKDLIEKEGQQQADKEIIAQLKQTIKEKEAEISKKVSSLPFGVASFLTGSTYNINEVNLNSLLGTSGPTVPFPSLQIDIDKLKK